MSLVITATLLLIRKWRQSASTKAVLPEPTGPPIPILRGLGVTIGTTSRQAAHGAWRQFQCPARNSKCQSCPHLELLWQGSRSTAPRSAEFAGQPTGRAATSATQRRPVLRKWNRGERKPSLCLAILGRRRRHRKPWRDGRASQNCQLHRRVLELLYAGHARHADHAG